MKIVNHIFGIIVFLLLGEILFAQSSEQKVTESVNKINRMVEEVHQLATQRDFDNAFKKLSEINRTFSTEFTWGTFMEEYRNAKMENPSFHFQLRSDLPAKFDPNIWKDYQYRCDGIMADQNQALEGFKSMLELNKWDKIMAYGAQIKNSYETIKNATENLGSGNIPKFAYDLYGNMNDFIKNYTKIQDAEIAGVDIQTQRMEFQNMIRKAEQNKELYRNLESTIRVNIDMIHTFNSNIKYVQDRKAEAAVGPLKPLGPTLDYVWNYEFFEKQVKEACDKMEYYEIKCAKLKSDIEDITSEARKDWSRVKGNIYASDDEAQKDQYLSDCAESWAEFSNMANQMYDEAFQLYCLDHSADSGNSNNTEKPFDGAAAGGASTNMEQEDSNTAATSSNTNEEDFVFENIKIASQLMDYGGGQKFLDITYDVVFPGEDAYNVFYLQNGELDGEKVTQNSRYKTKIGYGNRLSLSFNVPISNDLDDGNHQLKVILDLGQVFGTKDFSTSFSVSGNSVQQGSTNDHSAASSPNGSPDEESKSDNNQSAEKNTNIPSNATLIGKISKTGRKGQYQAIEISKLQRNDKIQFVCTSGKIHYVELIWRKEGGIWETAVSGTKTEYEIKDIIDKIPPRTTHLNFVANSHHNYWNAEFPDCKANVYLIHNGGGSLPGSSSATGGSIKPESKPKTESQTQKNSKQDEQAKPSNDNRVNTINKEFNELLNKARESFNKPYWEESKGSRASSNPKQESLSYLVKASRLINREPNPKTKFDMVLSLVNMSSQFAQRIYAYENKVPFINLAGRTASSAGSQISGIQESDPEKKKELKKYAYSRLASSWKCVREATLVQGGTNYSKESCDREYVKYKKLSE